MKKSAIFTIVACSITVVVLVGVLAVGLMSDGFGVISLFHGETGGPMDQEYTYGWDPSETDVDGLDISWINGTVDIKVGSDGIIHIIERSNRELKDQEKLQLSSSGGTLKIKWNQEFISFGLFHNMSKDLTVEVPKELADQLEKLSCANTSGTIRVSGFTAEELSVSSISGDLELSALSAEQAEFTTTSGSIQADSVHALDELNVSTTSGSVNVSGAEAKRADLSTVSGSVNYEGSAEEFSAGSVSASVDAELSACPESADLESVSGSLELTIPENDGFEAEYSSISGGFSSDFPVTGDTGKSGRVLYGKGKAKFEFSTTSGDMRVLKK